jgi:hypothetical protein
VAGACDGHRRERGDAAIGVERVHRAGAAADDE